jgi:hypothetical protein
MAPAVRRKDQQRGRCAEDTAERADRALPSHTACHVTGGQIHRIGRGALDAEGDSKADQRHEEPDAVGDQELPARVEEEGVQACAPRLVSRG